MADCGVSRARWKRQLWRPRASNAASVPSVVGEVGGERLKGADDEVDRSVGMAAGPAPLHERCQARDAPRGLGLGDARCDLLDGLREGVQSVQARSTLTGALAGEP